MTSSRKFFGRHRLPAALRHSSSAVRHAFAMFSRSLIWEAREVLFLVWLFGEPAFHFRAFQPAEPKDRKMGFTGRVGQA